MWNNDVIINPIFGITFTVRKYVMYTHMPTRRWFEQNACCNYQLENHMALKLTEVSRKYLVKSCSGKK